MSNCNLKMFILSTISGYHLIITCICHCFVAFDLLLKQTCNNLTTIWIDYDFPET